MRSQPASIVWIVTSTVHFIIFEVTQNILIYELDMLYIFDINIVYPCEVCEFIWFLICYYAKICYYAYYATLSYLILLIQLWATKIEIILFLSNMILTKWG